MADIRVEHDTIVFNGGEKTVRHPVKESLQIGEVIIVLLDVPRDTIDNRNVIGFSEDGQRLWEIEPISEDPTADQAYIDLYEKDGGVWVGNPIGAECKLDVTTGAFTEKEQRKW